MRTGNLEWYVEDGGIRLQRSEYMDIDKILDCGQCFRWRIQDDVWRGVVDSRAFVIRRQKDSWLLEACSEETFRLFWARYLDLDRDYEAINSLYEGLDLRLDTALSLGRGIRILRQPFWETVLSFVLSANNNIPRIQGMIDRLSRAVGEPLGNDLYGFPEPKAVALLTEADLRDMKFGYRAVSVVKLAQGFLTGRWSEDAFITGSTPQIRKKLLELPGVGPKVADCILLFGLGRLDAFPVDTWIRKTLEELDQGKPDDRKIMRCLCDANGGGSIGYVQQVLFYSARYKKWGD